MTTTDELRKMVDDMRSVHESMLAESNIARTAGTCLYASIILQTTLERFGNCSARVRGGDGHGDGGLLDDSGVGHGHYWVEGRTSSGLDFVADITADQFGHSPVYFEALDVARKRYIPGDDHIVTQAAEQLREACTSAWKSASPESAD